MRCFGELATMAGHRQTSRKTPRQHARNEVHEQVSDYIRCDSFSRKGTRVKGDLA